MLGLSFFAVMMIFGLLTSLAALAVILYTLYDIILKQGDMDGLEKLIWILIILVLNLVGAIIYLAFKYTDNLGFMDRTEKDLEELERLKQLRDEEAITEEEYQELKKDVIQDLENH